MTRHVTLVRHAESELNIRQPSIIGGRSRWCELTPRGIAQARHLGRWLRDTGPPIDRVVSSTAVRAQQTARYSLEQTDIPLRRLETFTELEEMCQGDWENRDRSATHTPEFFAQLARDPWHFRAPGGESSADVFARGLHWLDTVARAGPGPHTWVFTHGMVIKLLVAGISRSDRRTAWQLPIQNTSLTRLHHTASGWVVVQVNTFPQGVIDDAMYR